MDAQQFLDRLIPPGNFIAIAYKSADGRGGMKHRFFPRSDTRGAAGFIKWCASKQIDAWHACAAYQNAQPVVDAKSGRTHYEGLRTQANVQALKAFWIDLDIMRPGVTKAANTAFADDAAARAWLKTFITSTGMPIPNMWVYSGGGWHLYWVLQDALDPVTWHTYATALKAAMMTTNPYGCDLNVVADSARIMRPPEGVNFKVLASPVVVKTRDNMPMSGDWPNAIVLGALQPFIGLQTVAQAASAPGLLGSAPVVPGHTSSATQAAQANMPAQLKDKSFAEIAQKCLQVKQSVAAQGAGDSYSLWYLGHLSLAHHTHDGAGWVHEISKGDPRYTANGVDAAVQRIENEKTAKPSGPPRCTSYNTYRPGVCTACPFWQKVISPWNLGAKDGDLPRNWRRHNAMLQRAVPGKDGVSWIDVLPGDVCNPVVFRRGRSHAIRFDYVYGGTTTVVTADDASIGAEITSMRRMWSEQGVTLRMENVKHFGDFVVAWIEQARTTIAVVNDTADPFGWQEDDAGNITGLALAGTVYKADGTVEQLPLYDSQLAEYYTPKGALEPWRAAAKFVLDGRPDLQLMVAASMGAPLMHFTGERGLVLHWFSSSGRGKTSGARVAQTVWGATAAMSSLDDTDNQRRALVGTTKVLPRIWDEARNDDKKHETFVTAVFSMTQGKDKGRLTANAGLRPVSEWATLMLTIANEPLLDHVRKMTSGTDAGLVRLFEIDANGPAIQTNSAAGPLVSGSDRGVGQAGAKLAAYFAAHAPQVRAALLKIMEQLSGRMKSEPNERFYVAGLSCALMGAIIGKKLGLYDFDIPALQQLIDHNWARMRAERELLMTRNGRLDIVDIFSQIIREVKPWMVVTSTFLGVGGAQTGYKVEDKPLRDKDTALAQIGRAPGQIRIDYKWLSGWCKQEGLPMSVLIEQTKKVWGAQVERVILAARTDWSSISQVRVLTLPLRHPDLKGYEYGDDPPTTVVQPAGRKSPAAQVAGNQPKVV